MEQIDIFSEHFLTPSSISPTTFGWNWSERREEKDARRLEWMNLQFVCFINIFLTSNYHSIWYSRDNFQITIFFVFTPASFAGIHSSLGILDSSLSSFFFPQVITRLVWIPEKNNSKNISDIYFRFLSTNILSVCIVNYSKCNISWD